MTLVLAVPKVPENTGSDSLQHMDKQTNESQSSGTALQHQCLLSMFPASPLANAAPLWATETKEPTNSRTMRTSGVPFGTEKNDVRLHTGLAVKYHLAKTLLSLSLILMRMSTSGSPFCGIVVKGSLLINIGGNPSRIIVLCSTSHLQWKGRDPESHCHQLA
jgi:hypothetical protein